MNTSHCKCTQLPRLDTADTIINSLLLLSWANRDAHRKLVSTCVSVWPGLERGVKNFHEFSRCAKFLGEKHQHIASSLVPELLSTHPFFATPEPSVDDPAYVAILILVFNATAKSPTMLAMFPDHTNRHYAYLRDSQPDLVPHLDIEKGVIELDEKKSSEEG